MLHVLAGHLSSIIHSNIWHTSCCVCPTVQTHGQILLKALICSKQTAVPFCAMSGRPLSLWCLQCCWWHSAGCRTSWVCLQHHATVVTSNGVTVCGSKFPPTVSKHCQHQHSAIHKTIPTIWSTINPSCCDIQGAAPSVQHQGSLCSQPDVSCLMSLQVCKHKEITMSHNLQFYSLWSFPAEISEPYLKCPTANIQR